MKILFEMVVGGEDSLRQKFLKEIEENPNLQNELVNYIGQGIMWGFHLRIEDKITIDSFRIKELQDSEIPKIEENKS